MLSKMEVPIGSSDDMSKLLHLPDSNHPMVFFSEIKSVLMLHRVIAFRRRLFSKLKTMYKVWELSVDKLPIKKRLPEEGRLGDIHKQPSTHGFQTIDGECFCLQKSIPDLRQQSDHPVIISMIACVDQVIMQLCLHYI